MIRARELGGGSETEGAVVEEPVNMQTRDIMIDDLDTNVERVQQKRRVKKRGQSNPDRAWQQRREAENEKLRK